MQYSLKYVTLLLVAFSLSLASSSWIPPIGSGATLIVLIVGLRLFWNPPWLGWTVWGAVWGAVAFAAICIYIATVRGEAPNLSTSYAIGQRYAIPIGGILGGMAGHALFVRASKREEDESEA